KVTNALARFPSSDYCSNLTFYYCTRGLDPHPITRFDFLHLLTSLREVCTCLRRISRRLIFPAEHLLTRSLAGRRGLRASSSVVWWSYHFRPHPNVPPPVCVIKMTSAVGRSYACYPASEPVRASPAKIDPLLSCTLCTDGP